MSNGNLPLVTVITVVYNGAATLESTIKSVLDTNYTNLEFFVIDGCSSDETLSIIKKYSKVISYWISEPDKGIYDAMNKGWAHAALESYILFLGSGDRIISFPAIRNNNHKQIFFGEVYKGEQLYKSVHNFKLKLGNTIHHQALLIPKLLHPEPPFDLRYKIYADFDFNQRLNKRGIRFVKCDDFKVYALPDGISTVKREDEMLSIVYKNYGQGMKCLALIYYKLQKLKSLIGKKK
jgi:glycosyltransferase involved in cell wall biosynthesis